MDESLRVNSGSRAVLIIGAGCTGLAIAQGLKKNSIPFILLEQEQQNASRARDWNMGLHWGAPILSTLIPSESFAKLESAQVDPHRPCPEVDEIKFFNGETGDQIGGSRIPHIYRLRRKALRGIMAEGLIVGSELLYNKYLINISYSDDGETVTAHFEDGTSLTGSCLIGADGPRSQVRQLLVGKENAKLQSLPICASIVQSRYSVEQVRLLRSLHPLFVVGLHPKGLMSWVGLHHAPSPDDPVNWIMNHYISWRCEPTQQEEMKHWTNDQHLEKVREMAMEFCDPYRSAFEWLRDNQKVWWGPLTQWDPSEVAHRWRNREGRVTIAGDAAHPMTFQRGQGLNSAFKDASELVNQIITFLGKDKSQTRQAAIDAYEREMTERTGIEVRLSSENSRMVHVWDEVLQSPLVSRGFAKTEQEGDTR